jgi:hypothetical protein
MDLWVPVKLPEDAAVLTCKAMDESAVVTNEEPQDWVRSVVGQAYTENLFKPTEGPAGQPGQDQGC